jgi:hypothetical protein
MDSFRMSERDEIALARQTAPDAVRALAQIARDFSDTSARNAAISGLVARRFLATHHPSDDDLQRIENMTDAEIGDVLNRSLQ